MKNDLNRRKFLKSAIAGGLGAGISTQVHGFNILSAYPVQDKHRIAVMGVNSRGMAHAAGFASLKNAEIAYICDVDERALASGIEGVMKAGQKTKPKGVSDFRRALDDKSVDVLTIAAPDHWHAPASILGLKAGKHIYVEKPGSHNPSEGELLTQAAKKYNKVVQMGNQRRSWPRVREAIQALHEGAIGRVYFARTWYTNTRPSIGTGKIVAVPSWLDYELWQGPAPRKSFKDNLIHYNWHWNWHWGTGEILNNGTHFIDLARWGLDVDLPVKAFSTGGRYHYQDDWQTPDTQIATFDFEDRKTISWEARSCNPRGINDMGSGVSFHGENGTLEIKDNAYKIFNNNGDLVKSADSAGQATASQVGPGIDFDKVHFVNFLESIETGKTPHSTYSDCSKSVLLCHLGNISYRVGRALDCDPQNGHILKDDEAMKLWNREYQGGWAPTIA
ncbi:MAG: Gfo/Idh/MocA family oxidoreductase [Cyclobacteriaceae bacterium]